MLCVFYLKPSYGQVDSLEVLEAYDKYQELAYAIGKEDSAMMFLQKAENMLSSTQENYLSYLKRNIYLELGRQHFFRENYSTSLEYFQLSNDIDQNYYDCRIGLNSFLSLLIPLP